MGFSHTYTLLVSVQKISPDTKDKVQLQVQMHDGSAMTFQFSNPGRTRCAAAGPRGRQGTPAATTAQIQEESRQRIGGEKQVSVSNLNLFQNLGHYLVSSKTFLDHILGSKLDCILDSDPDQI